MELTRVEINALILWLGLINLFQLIFAVGIVRYKILFLPAALTLVLCGLGKRLGRYFWPVAVLFFLMGLVNFSRALPLARSMSVNPDLPRIAWVRQTVLPADFYLFAGDGDQSITNVALRYFAPEVRARSMRGFLFEQYGRADFKLLEEEMNGTWSRGGRVYVESDLWIDRRLQVRLTGSENPLARWLQNFVVVETLTGPNSYSAVKLVKKGLPHVVSN